MCIRPYLSLSRFHHTYEMTADNCINCLACVGQYEQQLLASHLLCSGPGPLSHGCPAQLCVCVCVCVCGMLLDNPNLKDLATV